MLLYCLPATLVFVIALRALLRDTLACRTDLETWMCFTLASLLWPITLPAILRIKYQKYSGLVASTQGLLFLKNRTSL